MPSRRFSRIKPGRGFCIDALEVRQLLSAPPLPTIPAGTFDITTYGATANDTTDDTAAIQAAINACHNSANKGGTVVIPAGSFLAGSLNFFGSMNLNVVGTLKMLPYGTYSGSSNWLNWSHVNNVEISGTGTIDGQGGVKNASGQNWYTAYKANGITRPRICQFTSVNTVYLHGVTIQNSPQFHCAFSGTNSNVTIDGVTIKVTPTVAGGNPDDGNQPNTDAMDLAGKHFLVQNCTIDVGDDDVVAKPGGTFCGDIVIQHCTILHGHGVSVGGQTNDGLGSFTENGVTYPGMVVNDVSFNGTTDGLRLKADRTEGGLVQDISYSNITMSNVKYPILFYSYYNTGLPSDPTTYTTTTPTSTEPYWQNISITNMTVTNPPSGYNAGVIWGYPEAPIQNVTMTNVKLAGNRGFEINHARNISFDSTSTISVSSGSRIIATSSLATPYDATVVKAGWTDSDVNAPTPPSSSVYDPNTDLISLIAGGAGIAGASDQFNMETQDISGNALVSAKISTIQNTSGTSKAGVIFRDGTAAGAMFAAVVEQPNKQVAFLYRSSTNGSVVSTAFTGDTTSVKSVKLARVGDTFTASYSINGTTWTQIGSPVSIVMPASLKAGLCVTSSTTSATCSASFTSATVVNDNTPPTLTSDAYLYSTSLNKLTFTFSEDVSASLSTNSLTVATDPGGSPITVSSVVYNSQTNTATFTLATPLPDGNYTATLSAASTTDAIGNPLTGGNQQLSFFVLPGDVNRDGAVNALDFNTLASNYGSAGGFSQGDLDFNGTVNTADFTILADNFGTTVNAQGAAPLAANSTSPSLFSSVTVADKDSDPLSLAGTD